MLYLIYLAQDGDRFWVVTNTVMNPRVPCNAENFSARWEAISFTQINLFHCVRIKDITKYGNSVFVLLSVNTNAWEKCYIYSKYKHWNIT
jgi:hypothetical protein